MKIHKILSFCAIVATAFTFSCSEEEVDPMLMDSENFVAPAFVNATTAETVVITAENASELFETFSWSKPSYGVNLSVNYVLQVDNNEDFSNAKQLMALSTNQVDISKERFNATMLSLGLPGFKESQVYMRVRATINGYVSDTLYTDVIVRKAVTYQNSECGNFCTLGIIGSATPGGWDNDTDLRLSDATRADKANWTSTLYLIGGSQVKFRAGDAWETNWGGTDFPSGTGTINGPDITVSTTGYYEVKFNDETGAYTFTLLSAPNYPTIGIIGNATPGGWDNDTDLTKDATNPHIWTGTITLTAGEAKFRADNDWANNWGATSYPSGIGTSGGPNIPVNAGTYFVRFNDVTGEYAFMATAQAAPFDAVGIIGDATPAGWDADTDLIKNPTNPYLWSKVVELTDAEAKFRANDAWDINWGGADFPGGIGAINGPNIPTKAGKYYVTFHTGTGEYYFLK